MRSWISWLCLFLFFFHSPSQSLSSLFSPSPRPRCHTHESSALIQFRNSFSIENHSSDCNYYSGTSSPNSTISWDVGKDCCTWSGVTCDEVTGYVIGLHLKCSGLRGIISSNNSLILLTHHQTLILSRNNFEGSEIPAKFGKFQSMIHLDLSVSNFSGRVPLELSSLSNLVTLDLRRNFDLIVETSSLKQIVANLTSLKELVLSHVNMSHVLPNSFMNLSTSLRYLDLRQSGLAGEFPENILNLKNLRGLHLSYNEYLIGSFLKCNWTTSLRDLGLSRTGFLVDLSYLTRNLKNLNTLYVNGCIFVGSFPAFLRNLTQITSLGIASNNLGGQIPWDSLNLEKLTYLDLSANNFSGQLPEICKNSTRKSFLCDPSNNLLLGPLPINLRSLLISHNLLNGIIPSWLYSLPSLQELSLNHNHLTGQINEFQFRSLTILQLNSNKLHDLIPRSIFQQVNLYWLDLSSNNLSGVVMLEQIASLKNLQHLSLSFNRLSLFSLNNANNTLPNTLWTLRLSSCNITEFPYSLRGAEYLGHLDLSNNRIQGSLPKWLSSVGKDTLYHLNISHNFLTHIDQISWRNLQLLDLYSNSLQGQLPIPPHSTVLFSVSKNQMVGEIPSLFCNLSLIEVLDLSNNRLSGNIPPCAGNFSKFLSVLDLRMNNFHGMIPPAFANSLMTLNLHGNQLEGLLPHSLLNCRSLEVLDVGNNKLSGSFPQWLESLTELQVLILGSNRFHGPITSNPKVRSPFRKLRILDLSSNEFTGPLPKKYFENFAAMRISHKSVLEYMEIHVLGGYYYRDSVRVMMKGFYFELAKIQTMFMAIDCSRNNFTGEIPHSVGKLTSLKGLDFSHNKLTGAIPASFGNLSNLEWLDLSSNELVGRIPSELASNLNQLEFLNLSRNKLEGPIPRGPQFDTFKENAFAENPQLCGFPLPKPCTQNVTPKDEDDDEEHSDGVFSQQVVTMGFACGLVIGISLGYIVFFSTPFDYWLMEVANGGGPRCLNFLLARMRAKRSRTN